MRLDLGAIPHELLNRFLLYQTSPALAGLFFSGQHLGQQSANLAQLGKTATAKRYPKAPLLARIAVQEGGTRFLGHVNAPDREAAKIAAVERFKLDDEQRRRLVVQERA